VATQPLFDLSGIDLSRIAVTAEEVGRLNPQSGAMRHLDHVIWHSPNYAETLGVKYVRPDEFWVSGHIPGRPLLPGVIMIEAAAQLGSVAYRKRSGEPRFLAFTRIDDVVFRAQVVPGDTLYLLAKEEKFNPRRFICAVQGIVSGQVAFEARITGMVVNDDQGRG